MERVSIGDETNPAITARLTTMVNNGQNNYGSPATGTGDNPLAILRVEPNTGSPETVEDYVKTVDFRFLALQRWIESGENRLALETIARIEGDLQQIRLMLKGAKKLVEG